MGGGKRLIAANLGYFQSQSPIKRNDCLPKMGFECLAEHHSLNVMESPKLSLRNAASCMWSASVKVDITPVRQHRGAEGAEAT